MELTKESLKQKQQEYQNASEQFREQYIANMGAAKAILQLIADMSLEEVPIEEVTTEDGKPLKDMLKTK